MAQNRQQTQRQNGSNDRFSNNRNKPDLSGLIYGKVPPQALDLEAAVLGAIMQERDRLEEVLDIIHTEEAFYSDQHQKIFSAIRNLFAAGAPIDLLTVKDELTKAGELEMVGGLFYLMKLTGNVVTSAHTEMHSRLIIEKYLKREQIRLGGLMVSQGYDDSIDAFDQMEDSQNELFQLSTIGIKQDYRTGSEVAKGVMIKMAELKESGITFSGITTPYKNLNDLTGGWQPKNLIIVAARPAVGKTAVAGCFALACAQSIDHGGAIGFFTLEMASEELVKRMLANIANVSLNHIQKPWKQQADEPDRMNRAFNEYSKLPIYIDDNASLTVIELRAKVRRMNKRAIKETGKPLQMVIVDYLQLMEESSVKGNREQEISKISRGLKRLAMDMNIPVIALSQLNRGVEGRAENVPLLSDLRESGAIEQDANMVILLYEPSKATQEKSPHLKGKVMMHVAKNRNGGTEEFAFVFNKEHQRWEDVRPEHFPAQNFRPLKPEEMPGYQPNTGSQPYKNNDEPDDLPF